jgi:thiamine-phosphate pyrophosphorylase
MQKSSNPVDLRLYALIDPERAGRRSLAEIATLIAPSATLVQLRDKHGSTHAMIDEGRHIKSALAASRVPLLINDRVDVALAVQADGVHVGWDDMEGADARRLLGPEAIIGLSLQTIAQAKAAPIEHLDYVAIGGVFVTQSKENPKPPVGLDGFQAILAVVRARAPHMPVVAIAGIDASNAAGVISAGADGVAMISALSLAPDPAQAARDMRAIVDGALAKRGPR